MNTPVTAWNTNPNLNGNLAGISMYEGMPPNLLNDGVRAAMASIFDESQLVRALITSGDAATLASATAIGTSVAAEAAARIAADLAAIATAEGAADVAAAARDAALFTSGAGWIKFGPFIFNFGQTGSVSENSGVQTIGLPRAFVSAPLAGMPMCVAMNPSGNNNFNSWAQAVSCSNTQVQVMLNAESGHTGDSMPINWWAAGI